MYLCCSVSFMRCQPGQQQACVCIFHDMPKFAPVKGAVLDMHHPSLIFSSFAILPSSFHRLPPVPWSKAQLLPGPSLVPDWRPLVFSTAKIPSLLGISEISFATALCLGTRQC